MPFTEWHQGYTDQPTTTQQKQLVSYQTCTKPTRIFCKYMYPGHVIDVFGTRIELKLHGVKQKLFGKKDYITTNVFFKHLGAKGPWVWSCLVFSASIFAVNNWITTATLVSITKPTNLCVDMPLLKTSRPYRIVGIKSHECPILYIYNDSNANIYIYI